MKRVAKNVLAVVAGTIAGMLVIFSVESVSQVLYAPPASLDYKDPQMLKAFIATLPAGAFALVLLAYVFGSFFGGLVATLLAGRASRRAGLIVGLFLTVAGAMNVLEVPQPTWFAVVSMLVYLPLALLGSHLVIKPLRHNVAETETRSSIFQTS